MREGGGGDTLIMKISPLSRELPPRAPRTLTHFGQNNIWANYDAVAAYGKERSFTGGFDRWPRYAFGEGMSRSSICRPGGKGALDNGIGRCDRFRERPQYTGGCGVSLMGNLRHWL